MRSPSISIADAELDLGEALTAFKAAPSTDTLDDLYAATTALETACRLRVESMQGPTHG